MLVYIIVILQNHFICFFNLNVHCLSTEIYIAVFKASYLSEEGVVNCFKIYYKYVSSVSSGTEWRSKRAHTSSPGAPLVSPSMSAFCIELDICKAQWMVHHKSHYQRTLHLICVTCQKYILLSSTTLLFLQRTFSFCSRFSSRDSPCWLQCHKPQGTLAYGIQVAWIFMTINVPCM